MSDNVSNGRCLLILNQYLAPDVSANPMKKLSTSGSGLFNVEQIRDFTMCGYYTFDPNAPSFLQHLLTDSYSRNDSALGISTFVIGNYASDYSIYDHNSRLDRELYNSTIAGEKIRGLPGCRDYSTCADSPSTGIFAVSHGDESAYGLSSIACDNTEAGCN